MYVLVLDEHRRDHAQDGEAKHAAVRDEYDLRSSGMWCLIRIAL